MKRHQRRGAAFALSLAPLACMLAGCGLPGTVSSSAASTSSHGSRAAGARGISATGTWVFRNSYTVETLHLQQGKGGAVGGSGNATVKNTKGQAGQFSITVHTGHRSKKTLALSLYMLRTDAGSYGMTLVEYLTCAASPSVLHCRMTAPLYANVRNVPQDFVRRA